MNIVIFNWRDVNHAKAGGAEISTHTLAKGLAQRGHTVTWFTSRAHAQTSSERRDGYKVIHKGSEITCRFHALAWFIAHSRDVDVVVDEVNTLPFLSPLLCRERVVLWMHQIAREVWLAEAPRPIGAIGYVMERWMLQMYKGLPAITVSESSAKSIREYVAVSRVVVAENALQPPVAFSERVVPGRLGYVGRLAPSKRVGDIIKALALVQARNPSAHLIVVGRGSESYITSLKQLALDLGVSHAVHFAGRLPDDQRDAVLQTLDVIVMASMREGWGLVISEAARYGVPGVVYPVDGLIDSVQQGRTGLICDSATPASLAGAIISVVFEREYRDRLGCAAMHYISRFSEERFIGRFEQCLREHARVKEQPSVDA